MAEKLSGVRGQVRRADNYYEDKRVPHFALPPADTIGEDGVDHINIWEHAATEFGIVLDKYQDTPFIHPLYKNFRSIEGFWHYLRSTTRDDRHRTTYGPRAKQTGFKQRSERVPHFRYIIMDATWHKVIQFPAIVEEMKVNDLPFDMYHLNNGDARMRIRDMSAFWMVKGFEEIRKAIREDRKPNFDFLLDVGDTEKPDLSGRAVKHKAAKVTGKFTAKNTIPNPAPAQPSGNPFYSANSQSMDNSINGIEDNTLADQAAYNKVMLNQNAQIDNTPSDPEITTESVVPGVTDKTDTVYQPEDIKPVEQAVA